MAELQYPRLLEEVKLHIPRFGLTVEDERYALARDGNQMFGVLTCKNGHVADWGLAIGIRSSYDRSLAVDLVAGARVFVCDNLSFHGESQVSRKHTVNVPPGGKMAFDVTADAAGDWAFHCHNLYHMAAGMMRVVTVRPLAGDTQNVAS